jgi:hypothetical protein
MSTMSIEQLSFIVPTCFFWLLAMAMVDLYSELWSIIYRGNIYEIDYVLIETNIRLLCEVKLNP